MGSAGVGSRGRVFVIAAASIALAACGDEQRPASPEPVIEAVAVDTQIAPASVVAGGQVTVGCSATPAVRATGAPVVLEVAVTPPEGVVIDGATLTANRSGVFDVTCRERGGPAFDATPARLEVVPGPMVGTAMKVTPDTVPAGEPAALECHGVDALGNPTGDAAYTAVTPSEGVSIADKRELTATVAGRYELVCETPAVPDEAKGRAALTVIAGDEVRRALAFEPRLPAHGVGQTIIVQGVGLDAFGNARAETYPVSDVRVSPEGHHRLFGDAGDHLSFDLEGKYVVTATVAGSPLSATLVVDETPPVIDLSSPARGQVSDGDPAVEVSGAASDNLGDPVSIEIDGEPVPVDPESGAFDVSVPLAYGLSPIVIRAADAYGNARLVTRSVEHSSAFHPLVDRTLAGDGVASALVVALTQEVIDDGDRDEPDIDDLGTLLERVIEGIDVAALVDNPVATFKCGSNGDCQIHLTGISVGDAHVTLTLGPGRLHVVLDLDAVEGDIACYFPCNLGVICHQNPGMVPGTATFEHAHLETDLRLYYSGQAMEAAAEGTAVELTGLAIQVDEPTGIIPAFIQATLALIEEDLVAALETMLGRLVEDKLGGALGKLFNGFARDVRFAVPSLSGAENRIALTVAPRAVDIAPERMQVRVDALALTETPHAPYPHLGSIDHDGCRDGTPLPFPPPAPVVAAIHDDLVNELLYALWEGGTLSMDIPAGAIDDKVGSFGMQDFAVRVDARLPPVFETCRGENRVEIGDLFVDAAFTLSGQPVHMAAWLQLEAPLSAEVGLDADGARTLTLVLGDIEPFIIETVVNEGLFASDDEQFADLLRNMMLPQLFQGLGGLLTFRLPSLDLGSFTSAIPEGTVLDIDVSAIARDNAYLLVEGGLR